MRGGSGGTGEGEIGREAFKQSIGVSQVLESAKYLGLGVGPAVTRGRGSGRGTRNFRGASILPTD